MQNQPTGRSAGKLAGPGNFHGKVSPQVRWLNCEAEAAILEAERLRSDIDIHGQRLGEKPGRTELLCQWSHPQQRAASLMKALYVWCRQRQVSFEECSQIALQEGEAVVGLHYQSPLNNPAPSQTQAGEA